MNIPPVPIQPVAPVEGVMPQPQGGFAPPGQGQEAVQGNAWLLMAQAILSRSPIKRMMKDFIIQHRVRPDGAKVSHTAVPLKREVSSAMSKESLSSGGFGKGEVASPFRAQREAVPAFKQPNGDIFPREKTPSNQSADKFSVFAHKLSMREVKERVSEAFAHTQGPKDQLPRMPFGSTLERRELLPDDKRIEKEALERAKDKEKVEDTDKDKLKDKLKDKEKLRPDDKQDRAKVSENRLRVEQDILEKLVPPPFLAGIGLTPHLAQQIMSSPAFQSAKMILIVKGAAEKLVLTHFLQLYGSLKKQIFVWALESEVSASDAWVFLRRLGMPCISLMDLEMGSQEGGWYRVKFLLRKILAMEGKVGDVTEEMIAELPHWDDPATGMERWMAFLERYGIFFCGPLDFDYTLLQAFPKAYGAIDKYHELFIAQNRVVTHQEALRRMDSFTIMQQMPEVLVRLLRQMCLTIT